MTHLLLAVLLFLALALAWLFYEKFTRRGAIPLQKAWRDYTAWLGYAFVAFGSWIVDLARYVADLWDPLQSRFGDLLASDSAAMALQIIGAIFLALKLKGQAPMPKPAFPDFPDEPGQAEAAGS